MPLKVLVLDYNAYILREFPQQEGDVLQEEQQLFYGLDTYEPDDKIVNFLSALQPDAYDFIVIGNNLGAGLVKAEALPVALRERTVVVWNNTPTKSNMEPYAQLGYTRFTARHLLVDYLLANPFYR